MNRLLVVLLFIPIFSFSDNGKDLYFKALAQRDYKNVDSAIFLISKAIDLLPDSHLVINRSIWYFQIQNYLKAIDDAKRVVEMGNNNAYYNLARYYSANNEIEKAGESLKKYLETDGKLPQNIIRTDSLLNNLAKSVLWSEIWRNNWFSDVEEIRAEIYFMMRRGEYTKLFDIIDNALERFPDNDELFFYRYQVFFFTKNYKGALKSINKALRLAPDKHQYILAKARLLSESGKHKSALKDYTKYLNKCDLCIYEMREQASVAMKAERYALAYELLDYYLTFFYRDSEAWLLSGMALEEQKKYNDAIGRYNKMLEIDPWSSEGLFHRGRCYYEIGNIDDAFVDLCHSLDILPRQAKVFYYRGLVFYARGDKVAACRDWDRAKQLNYLKADEYMMRICRGL